MKSKQLMIYNLPTNNKMLAEIDAKPKFLFFVIMVLGVASFLLDISRLYGAMMIIFCLFAMSFMPRVALMEFYSDYLVMYNKADKNTCELIYYDDVVCWHYHWNPSRDYLVIELIDGSEERVEAFSKAIFEYQMNHFLKGKHKKTK